MNGEELLNKLELIDHDLIEEAATARKKKKVPNWKKWGAIAASICLVVIGASYIGRGQRGDEKEYQGSEQEGYENTHGITQDKGVNVPGIELPKNNNSDADMIGLIVYQGNIYTQAGWYVGKDADEIQDLVGERIGYAKGGIDEWSTQDEYADELASTLRGDVYTVNGYGSEFRICIQGEYENGDSGETIEYIEFYENLNGITLYKGEDFFEDRLHLMTNWESVQYQEHDNWNNAPVDEYEYHTLEGVTDVHMEEFFKELSTSDFVDLTGTEIYSENQAHLIVTMKDGTDIELRLFEGGYVGYQPMGWYFVKMPGEIFDLVFQACMQ